MSKVRNDKELQNEFVRLGAILQDKENWERRLDALQQLRVILDADASKYETFLAVLSQTIKIPLQSQIVDLRSAISREACNCVRSLCHSAASGAAEMVSDWYIKDLFNISCATVAAIAQAADVVLRDIAASGRVNRAAILAYLAACASKHAVIRKNAYHCLLILLHSVDPQSMIKHSAQVEKLLRSGVTDAVQEARKMSRLAIWAYERIAPKSARELLEGLESATRKAVEGERANFESWLEAGEMPEPTHGAPTRPGTSATAAAPPASHRAASPAVARQLAGDRRPSATTSGVHGGATASIAPTRSAEVAASSPPGYAARARSRSTRDESPAPPSSRGSGAQQSGRPSTTAPPPPRAQQGTSSGIRSGGAAPPPVVLFSGNAASASSTAAPAPSSSAADRAASDDSWYAALEGCNGSDWLTRLRAFDAVTEHLAAGSLSLSRAAECLPLVLHHLSDTHYRVVSAVMHSLDTMVEKFPDVVAPNLERLLIPLFQRLSDPKKQVADKAKSSLDALRRCYGVDTLVPVLHKVLDFNNNKVRVAAIEYMIYLLAFSATYFASASTLRATMHRMLHIAARMPPQEVHRATMNMLGRLYDKQREGFVAQLCALSPSEQSDSIELLRKVIPQVAQDCRRMQSGEALLRHPTAVSTAHSPQQQQQQQGTPQRGTRNTHSSPTPQSAQASRYMDPMQQFQSPRQQQQLGAGGLDATTVISASPIAQWRAEKAMPPEVAAFRSASTSEDRRAALRGAQASLTSNTLVWQDNFVRLLAFPLSYASDPADHHVRVHALRLLRAVVAVEALRAPASEQHEPMLRASISCLDDPFPEVQSEAMACFRDIASTFDPAQILKSLLRIAEALLPLNARCLEFVLRELVQPYRVKHKSSTIGGHYLDPSLIALLPQLIDVLSAAFSHHSSDIRKTAVLDFVDLYIALGDALLPRIAHLNHSQLKLISIYIVRAGVTTEPVDLVVKMIDAGIIASRY